MILLPLILCGESIAHIHEAYKRFLDPDSGNVSVFYSENQFFRFIDLIFRFKTSIPFLNQDQGSIFTVRECAKSIPRLEKRKNRRFSQKSENFSIFASI